MTHRNSSRNRLYSAFMAGTMLTCVAAPAVAQQPGGAVAAQPAATPPAATSQSLGTVRSISVVGNERLEAETVASYMRLHVGEPYSRESLDEALRDLYATELFSDVQIRENQGALTIEIKENPVINRIILEGNKSLKEDKITPEIRLAPRQIFTRSKARADQARIIELYRRQGRFAAQVEPKMVQLEQNRVDVVFEINEGPKSKVQQINIIGNEKFSDSELRGEMATKQARLTSFLSGNTSYDPDRLAYDQAKLRQFYLINGYADFRVVSAVAELTPDRRDFIITYVVEEGERYKFGDVKVESRIRDFKDEDLARIIPFENGDWYDAKKIEDTREALNETVGLFGYAFADVQPQISRDKDTRTMSVTFQVEETPRTYVERIDINGNTVTRDKVIRREFRLAEGDPFNSVRLKRSQSRIQSLGFFQDNLEIEQTQQASPDRVVLSVDVEEKATGELQLSAGFSSLERFLINASIRQRNFMGKGQELRASANYSTYSKSVELGFTEPYLFDRNIALGFNLYRRDFNSFNFINGGRRNTTYQQVATGGTLNSGVPLTEYMSLALRYTLENSNISLDRGQFFTPDPDGDGPLEGTCDPLRAGRYLCDAIGKRLTSAVGYSLLYSTLDNNIRPTRGERLIFSQDFAGLGGDVRYLRSRVEAAKYWRVGGGGFVFSVSGEAGYIHSFEGDRGPNIDSVRLTDRFFLGEPQIRGFDIRGVGPRVQRIPYDASGNFITDRNSITDDALGGRALYRARAELEIPLGSSGREMGLRPSVFVDAGAVFGLKAPALLDIGQFCTSTETGTQTTVAPGVDCPAGTSGSPGFKEFFFGDTPKPRVSVGFGVNWNSPFGPFRIDIAKALIKAKGDDTKLLTFNVGTAF